MCLMYHVAFFKVLDYHVFLIPLSPKVFKMIWKGNWLDITLSKGKESKATPNFLASVYEWSFVSSVE